MKIIFLSTWREEVSAEEIRIKYFKRALMKKGFIVKHYRLKITKYNKYLLYLLRRPPRNIVSLAKDAELIVTTSPPLINTIIGYNIAKKYRIPLIADIRDIWEEYAKTTWKLFTRLNIIDLIRKYFYQALEYANAIVVTTPKMKEYYTDKLRKDSIYVVSNGTDPDIIRCNNGDRERDLVYLGNFNNPNQALEFLLKALYSNDLSLVVIGGGKYLPRLKTVAVKEGVYSRVEFIGEVPYNDLSNYLCKAKVGVVGRPFIVNPQYLYTIPVKIYDYLSACLPVAGYGPKNSAYEEFILSNNVGIYVWRDDPLLLSNELVDLVNRSDMYRDIARQVSLRYDRKKLANKFAEVVEKNLQS